MAAVDEERVKVPSVAKSAVVVALVYESVVPLSVVTVPLVLKRSVEVL